MYLYRSDADSLFLTESQEGTEGLIAGVNKTTTIADLIDQLTIVEAMEVFKAYLGKKSSVEVFI